MSQENNLFQEIVANCTEQLCDAIAAMPLEQQVEALNHIRSRLHQVGPFKKEPVDCVIWRKAEHVERNDYNPNHVAVPEFRSLRRSVEKFGFGMPIVTWCNPENGQDVTVDGEHRGRVGKEISPIRDRIHGYLPVARLEESNRNDYIQATILFNEARGEHGIMPMTNIIAELLRNGWTDSDIARELGLDADEVLRFKHNTGLPDLFKNHEYSKAWE